MRKERKIEINHCKNLGDSTKEVGVVSQLFLFIFLTVSTGKLKGIMFFYFGNTFGKVGGMTMKMVGGGCVVTMINPATSVIISVGIFNMPVVTGILTSKSHTERRYLNRIKIFGINFQFFVRKHKQNSPSTFVRIHPDNLILYDRKKMFNSIAEGDA